MGFNSGFKGLIYATKELRKKYVEDLSRIGGRTVLSHTAKKA